MSTREGRIAAKILAAFLALLSIHPAAAGPQLVGAASAPDGGALEIDGQRLPLWGIAADPIDTPRGWTAQLLLRTLVSHGPARCTQKTTARWQCLTSDGSDVASLLVQTGQARAVDVYYSHEQNLAQAAQVGMWAVKDGGR